MGEIKLGVISSLIKNNPDQNQILEVFLHNFDVNYGIQTNNFGTNLFAYLLSPDKNMIATFGFNDEILLVYSPYSKVQPRTIQAIGQIFNRQPFRSRADPLTFIFVSEDQNAKKWILEYTIDHPQFRTPIVFTAIEVEENKDNRSYVRNKSASTLFTRDIFDYQLPLNEDLYFFGRNESANEILDAVRKSQNRGLFGLRKTGKTSLLFKVQRTLEISSIAYTLYLDCKRIDIRSKKWESLISYIVEKTKAKYTTLGNNLDASTDNPIEDLENLLRTLEPSKNLCIIFDEIEYISPIATLDDHWKGDFVNFWQIIWSLQSTYRNLSVIIAGVNPYVTEVDLIDGVQNPVFGIVQSKILTGLDQMECSNMIRRIGRQMGLTFSDDACGYLFKRYGGHPLLTRMACSYSNTHVSLKSLPRPHKLERAELERNELDRDAELQFYCRHIVSELKQFYPDEYVLLEFLAKGQIVDFVEMASEPEWIRHLKGYGVLNMKKGEQPHFRIKALERYIALQGAIETGTFTSRELVPKSDRSVWLERRKSGIASEFRVLLRVAAANGVPSPYGIERLPEAQILAELTICDSWTSFSGFATQLNICLYETMNEAQGSAYFFQSFRENFPTLFNSFNRLRVYRNNADHLKLNKNTETLFQQYIKTDLNGANISSYEEPYFLLQQIILDEIFASLLIELEKY